IRVQRGGIPVVPDPQAPYPAPQPSAPAKAPQPSAQPKGRRRAGTEREEDPAVVAERKAKVRDYHRLRASGDLTKDDAARQVGRDYRTLEKWGRLYPDPP